MLTCFSVAVKKNLKGKKKEKILNLIQIISLGKEEHALSPQFIDPNDRELKGLCLFRSSFDAQRIS